METASRRCGDRMEMRFRPFLDVRPARPYWENFTESDFIPLTRAGLRWSNQVLRIRA